MLAAEEVRFPIFGFQAGFDRPARQNGHEIFLDPLNDLVTTDRKQKAPPPTTTTIEIVVSVSVSPPLPTILAPPQLEQEKQTNHQRLSTGMVVLLDVVAMRWMIHWMI